MTRQKTIRAGIGMSPANYNIQIPPKTHAPIAWMQSTGMSDTTCPWVQGNSTTNGAKYIAIEHGTDNGCTVPNPIPTWTSGNMLCDDFAGCKAGYPTRVCTFSGGHGLPPGVPIGCGRSSPSSSGTTREVAQRAADQALAFKGGTCLRNTVVGSNQRSALRRSSGGPSARCSVWPGLVVDGSARRSAKGRTHAHRELDPVVRRRWQWALNRAKKEIDVGGACGFVVSPSGRVLRRRFSLARARALVRLSHV